MKIRDIMTSNIKACRPESNLAEVAMEMWDGDCGVVPVVDADRKVVSVITDRDICMGVATKHRRAEDIQVREIVRDGGAFTCMPGDDVHRAIEIMEAEKIRRLPVVKEDGSLAGIVSLNDVVLAVRDGRVKKGADLTYEDVIKAFKSVCEHRWPTVVAA